MNREDRDRIQEAAMAGIPLAPLLGMVWQRPSQRVMEQQAKRWTAKGRPAYVEDTPDLVDEFWGEVDTFDPIYRGQDQDYLDRMGGEFDRLLNETPKIPGLQEKLDSHLWDKYRVPTINLEDRLEEGYGLTRYHPNTHIFIGDQARGALRDIVAGHEAIHATRHKPKPLTPRLKAIREPQAEMGGALLRYVAGGGRSHPSADSVTLLGPMAYSKQFRPTLSRSDRRMIGGFAREVFGDTRGSVLKFGTPPPRMRGKSAIGLAALSALAGGAGGGAYLWNRLNNR